MWRTQCGSRGRLAGFALAAVLASGSLFLACGDDGTSPSEIVAAIAIDPPTAPPRIMAPGTTAQLTAVATNKDGDVVDVKFTWASSNASIVTVSSSGLVTALVEGLATVTASAQDETGTVLITVSQPVTLVEITPAAPFVDLGGTLQLSATVFDADGNELNLPATFTSNNPAVATVTPTGLLTGVAVGEATIVATSGEVTASVVATVTAPVASVTLTPAVSTISIDDTLQLSVVVADAQGNILNRPPTYTSSDPAVAVVDDAGKVIGKGLGSATITATAGGKHGSGTITVQPKVAAVTISSGSTGNRPLEIGATRQLTATVTDASGNVLARTVTWSSSSDAIATVDQTGLVTGVGSGDVIITAAVQQVSGTLEIMVVGEGEETTGNNLSWPVVFADGIGLTGSPVATDPGVRPSTAETEAFAEYSAIPPTNPTAAFFFSGNVPDGATGYYLQGTASTWRAQIVDGTGQPSYDASVYWGDNISGGSGNLGVDHPIRVEVALSTTDGVPLLGYSMPYIANPSSPEEVQGTDGTTLSEIPLIYSAGPTLTIEQLDGPDGNVVAEISSAVYKAEINVGGRIIYGAQFTPAVTGTYRLRFILASGANVRITEIGNATGKVTIVNPSESAIEVQVTP